MYGWMKTNTKCPSTARTAALFSSVKRSNSVGIMSRTASAGAYRAALDAAGAIPSMSRTGNCWDNAVAESFFATLEHELIVDHDWATHTQARHDIFVFIEEWYNRERQHSSLGYVSPAQYEQVRFAHSARVA